MGLLKLITIPMERDYALTGSERQKAISKGLAGAEVVPDPGRPQDDKGSNEAFGPAGDAGYLDLAWASSRMRCRHRSSMGKLVGFAVYFFLRCSLRFGR